MAIKIPGNAVVTDLSHDAASVSAAGTGNLTWEHTPVTQMPRGILVQIVQNATAADQVTKVTYGGVEMEEVPLSPELHTEGAEDGAEYAYFLGRGIPSGTQEVVVTVSGAASKRAVCISVDAIGDTRVEDTSILDSSGTANPQVELSTGVGVETLVYAALHTGQDTVGGVAAGTGYTEIQEHDFGSQVASWIRRTSNGKGGAITASWTATSEEAGVLGVAVGLQRDFGLVSSLPAIAGKGDICRYIADSTNGVIWDLIYDGEGEYPWKKIGGPALRAEDSEVRSTKSAAFQTTGAPSVTAPLKMEFRAKIGAQYINKGEGSTTAQAEIALYIAGSGPNHTAYQIQTFTFEGSSVERSTPTISAAAGNALQVRYACLSGVTFNFGRLFVEIDPIRVG